MRKPTIDEIWDYTKRMWKWVAFQKEVLKDERSVEALKSAWLKNNEPEFVGMTADCFFCGAANGDCNNCPGRVVDLEFDCCDPDHHYEKKPGAFYREILRLDAIRTAEPPKHEWVHGDVFKRESSGSVLIYLAPWGAEPSVCPVNRIPHGFGSATACLKGAVFLFNINDPIKEKTSD